MLKQFDRSDTSPKNFSETLVDHSYLIKNGDTYLDASQGSQPDARVEFSVRNKKRTSSCSSSSSDIKSVLDHQNVNGLPSYMVSTSSWKGKKRENSLPIVSGSKTFRPFENLNSKPRPATSTIKSLTTFIKEENQSKKNEALLDSDEPLHIEPLPPVATTSPSTTLTKRSIPSSKEPLEDLDAQLFTSPTANRSPNMPASINEKINAKIGEDCLPTNAGPNTNSRVESDTSFSLSSFLVPHPDGSEPSQGVKTTPTAHGPQNSRLSGMAANGAMDNTGKSIDNNNVSDKANQINGNLPVHLLDSCVNRYAPTQDIIHEGEIIYDDDVEKADSDIDLDYVKDVVNEDTMNGHDPVNINNIASSNNKAVSNPQKNGEVDEKKELKRIGGVEGQSKEETEKQLETDRQVNQETVREKVSFEGGLERNKSISNITPPLPPPSSLMGHAAAAEAQGNVAPLISQRSTSLPLVARLSNPGTGRMAPVNANGAISPPSVLPPSLSPTGAVNINNTTNPSSVVVSGGNFSNTLSNNTSNTSSISNIPPPSSGNNNNSSSKGAVKPIVTLLEATLSPSSDPVSPSGSSSQLITMDSVKKKKKKGINVLFSKFARVFKGNSSSTNVAMVNNNVDFSSVMLDAESRRKDPYIALMDPPTRTNPREPDRIGLHPPASTPAPPAVLGDAASKGEESKGVATASADDGEHKDNDNDNDNDTPAVESDATNRSPPPQDHPQQPLDIAQLSEEPPSPSSSMRKKEEEEEQAVFTSKEEEGAAATVGERGEWMEGEEGERIVSENSGEEEAQSPEEQKKVERAGEAMYSEGAEADPRYVTHGGTEDEEKEEDEVAEEEEIEEEEIEEIEIEGEEEDLENSEGGYENEEEVKEGEEEGEEADEIDHEKEMGVMISSGDNNDINNNNDDNNNEEEDKIEMLNKRENGQGSERGRGKGRELVSFDDDLPAPPERSHSPQPAVASRRSERLSNTGTLVMFDADGVDSRELLNAPHMLPRPQAPPPSSLFRAPQAGARSSRGDGEEGGVRGGGGAMR
eukprot:CAMPEP_0175045170 /NCGR_PEP_ID=MMETSP0052_2-20121109/4247_1 /TAXON_ID=51329 ORGANISM="Polytomella parva, Strain SAG 63-3" /NCGR_SAMPLE_ID=MMETSP0052_2 /ASSEMBLY_ACC=CAM_ASM_000194 /LENGTH=1034 /DNA_ID=CAMNT_0016308617 /DNA_START=217 /DNA_END=3318 /DNA_ORIENTATION=-